MKNILIADDEKDMRDLYEEFFHNLGLKNLTLTKDGIEAFMKCSIQKFDAIILDHKMPRLNGLDLLIALRSKAGPNQNTPVIIISGYLPEISEKLNTFDNTFFLTKPFDIDELSKCLKISWQ